MNESEDDRRARIVMGSLRQAPHLVLDPSRYGRHEATVAGLRTLCGFVVKQQWKGGMGNGVETSVEDRCDFGMISADMLTRYQEAWWPGEDTCPECIAAIDQYR